MKILLFFLGFISYIQAQQITHVTPSQLSDEIKKSGRPAVIQWWVPNCENVQEIVTNYKSLEKEHGNDIDFYFIGLTNKDSLVLSTINKTGYTKTLYVADASVSIDIYQRKEVFSKEFSRLSGAKSKDFITMYINNKRKVIYIGDNINISKRKLKKLRNNNI